MLSMCVHEIVLPAGIRQYKHTQTLAVHIESAKNPIDKMRMGHLEWLLHGSVQSKCFI